MTLGRTLYRRFELKGSLQKRDADFLRASPIVDHTKSTTDTIDVGVLEDGSYDAACSWGRTFQGSGRALLRTLDRDIIDLAIKDHGNALALSSAILDVGSLRLAFLGSQDSWRNALALHLVARGFAFEGAAVSFVCDGGLIAHPFKPRLFNDRGMLSSLHIPSSHLAEADYYPGQTCWTIDPTFAGQPWRVRHRGADVFILLRINPGGWTSITRTATEDAFAFAMRGASFAQRPAVTQFIQLKAMMAQASCFTLVIGDIGDAADALARRFF